MARVDCKQDKRDSAIELLRIIAIIGVVILHYNNKEIGGGLKYVQAGTINQFFLFFTENVFVSAVDLFVLISAYFLSTSYRRKSIKILELILQVIVFRIAFYLGGVVIGGKTFSIKNFIGMFIPVNYFVILYSTLYIISPYINLLLEKLDNGQRKKLLALLVGLFSVWTILVDYLENITGHPYNGLSTVGMYGSEWGYSIVNFTLLYIIGAVIRKNKVRISTSKAIKGIGITLVILYIMSYGEYKMKFENIATWNYNNPLVILMAIFILLLFLNFTFYSKFINEISKAAFTCFLFHGAFLSYLNIEKMVQGNILLLIIHQCLVGIGLYFTSYIVYKTYWLLSNPLVKLLNHLCEKISISLKMDEKER